MESQLELLCTSVGLESHRNAKSINTGSIPANALLTETPRYPSTSDANDRFDARRSVLVARGSADRDG